MGDISIIGRCGEFPNVSLLGIRGGITYNPSLALRQFSYAQRDGPHDMLIHGIMLNYEDDVQGYHQRFICAWGIVKKTDSRTLGHKWVRAWAQSLMMPYDSILPVILELVVQGGESRIILHPDMPTNFKELQKSWIQLKGEWDTFEAQFYASEKKVLELTKQLHEERNLNPYLDTKMNRPWET